MNSIFQWLAILDKLQQAGQKGQTAFDSIKAILASHGFEADTTAIDGVIADAARRQALAEREAGTSTMTAQDLGIITGSTGE